MSSGSEPSSSFDDERLKMSTFRVNQYLGFSVFWMARFCVFVFSVSFAKDFIYNGS